MAKKLISWEQKREILDACGPGGMTVMSASRAYGIEPQTIRRWRRELNASHMQDATESTPAIADIPGHDEAQKPVSSAILDPSQSGTATPPHDPAIGYAIGKRDEVMVKPHGKLPRGDFSFTLVALPKSLKERLEASVSGSKSHAIVGLVNYALQKLEKRNQTLHIYDANKGLELPVSGYVALEEEE